MSVWLGREPNRVTTTRQNERDVALALPHLQAYYERLGYHVVGYETHAGYTAPTAVVMEKQVS